MLFPTEGKLIVAAVQCKFVITTTIWNEVRQKIATAMGRLEDFGIQSFPVVYTTTDIKRLHNATCADSTGVCFTELDLFEFTKRLGPLSLMFLKQGQVLKKTYPWLTGLPHLEARPDRTRQSPRKVAWVFVCGCVCFVVAIHL